MTKFDLSRLSRGLALGLALAGTLGAAAAQALTVPEIQQRGYITVGISDQNPPYASLDADMQNSGLEIDLAKGLAAGMGVELRPVVVTSANRVACLLTRCADVLIHSLTITQERAAQVWFSQPYAESVFGIVGAADTPVDSIEDLADYRVGVVRAAFNDPLLTKHAPEGTTIQRYEDLSGLLQALLSGQVDVIAENSLVPAVLNRMRPGGNYENKLRFSAGYWGMAILPDQADLLQYLNTFLFTVKQDGTLDALYEKYLDAPAPELATY